MKIKPFIDFTAEVLVPHPAELTIRTATEAESKFITDRAQLRRKAVGWLPSAAIEQAIRDRWVWIARIDGQDAGHIMLTGGERTPTTLRHNCIESDLWENGLGTVFTRIYLAYSYFTSRHPVALVRTRADILAQTLINAHTGGRPIAVDAPRKTANGQGVVTWSWPIRQRPMRRVPVIQEVTTWAILNHLLTRQNAPHSIGKPMCLAEIAPLGASERRSA